jgi:hypothetical protein
LSAEGARLRQAIAVAGPDVDRMLEASLKRIAEEATVRSGRTVTEGILVLRALLDPVFGPGMVRAAVDGALGRTAPGGITVECWRAFVDDLSATIQSLCGVAAGRFAGRAAVSLRIGGV